MTRAEQEVRAAAEACGEPGCEWCEDEGHMPNAATTIRHVGFCPVCQGIWKVQSGLLVHHGYRRPGDGEIHGDCFGVQREPHELSPTTARLYLHSSVDPSVERAQRAVDDLKTEPEQMRFEKFDPEEARRLRDAGEPLRGSYVKVWQRRDQVSAYDWNQKLRSLRYQAQQELDFMLAEQKRVQGLIDTWQRRELGTVEDEVRKADQSRAEKKAIKDAARAEKEAKRAALDAKTQARQDAKNATALAFHQEFLALAQQPPSPARDEVALRLYVEAARPKYKIGGYPWCLADLTVDGIWGRDAGIQVLVELGLTEPRAGWGGPSGREFPISPGDAELRLRRYLR